MQSNGDLYSSTVGLDKIVYQIPNNFQLEVSVLKWKNLCQGASSNELIYQIFQDNMKKKVKSAGPIFCEPLNGKLLEFPVALTELEKINTF